LAEPRVASALDILMVEDSESDAQLVVRALRSSGFSPTWERVETVAAFREALLRRDWQIVISDSSVPRLGALEALAVANELAPRVPFIVVSGTLTEELAVEVLRRGAADYVTKDRLQRLGPAIARELSESNARETIAHRLLAGHEAELRRIARGLHDQFGQLLTALKLTLDSVQQRRGSGRIAALAEARSLVDELMSQARDFSIELWPSILDDLGLPAALRGLAERHARWSRIAVNVEHDLVDRLPFVVERACFRIAQQALTNVTRHAGASTAEIRLLTPPGSIELAISDDGRGFDVARARERAAGEGSLGLLSMHAHASLAGGRLEIDSVPNRGTTVRAHFRRTVTK
jgi:signal transduction histidine kinase